MGKASNHRWVPPPSASPLPYGRGFVLPGAIRKSMSPSMAALSISTVEGSGHNRRHKKARLWESGDGRSDGATEEKADRILGERQERFQANDGSTNGACDA